MNRHLTHLAAIAFSTCLAACGDPPQLYGNGNQQVQQSVAPGPVMKQPDPPVKKEYPSGNTGNMMGDVMAEFQVDGYHLTVAQTDSSQLKWETGLSPLAEVFNNADCKCLLLSYAATWCGACQQEQQALPAEVAKDKAFCVVNILQEGPVNGSNKVTKDDVDAWTQMFHQNYTVVMGTSTTRSLWNGYGGTIGLPFNFIIKVPDMTVQDTVQGFDPAIHDKAMAACGAMP